MPRPGVIFFGLSGSRLALALFVFLGNQRANEETAHDRCQTAVVPAAWVLALSKVLGSNMTRGDKPRRHGCDGAQEQQQEERQR